jgi:hypothetical protein
MFRLFRGLPKGLVSVVPDLRRGTRLKKTEIKGKG